MGKLNSVMRVEHQEAQTAFLEQLETLLTVCTHFDDDQLLAASRCRGWTVGDVLVHVHLGLQDMLLGVVWPVDANPDTDAASYWCSTVPTNDPQADQIARVRFVRLLGAAYRRPTGLVGHLRPTAEGLARAVSALREGALRFQGHVLSTGDFLATWAVELTVHHFDLGLELKIASP
ncbi:MAG: maleylpyruvate isomerase N-terminal domain-containing protein, partial [Actinomycetota bacterium]|nr:maleylpyruvate isomerase N-terminal domain-containing protein [Actinomycetota bacterium]